MKKVDDGSASIIGNYTLKKSGKYNNRRQVVKQNVVKAEKFSFSGDYDEFNYNLMWR